MTTTEQKIIEWRPMDDFNMLDTRDFKDYPLYDTPPYVLKFKFSNVEKLVLRGLVIDIMGWNLAECQTNILFSKIDITKNNTELYSTYTGGTVGKNNLVFGFVSDMVLQPNDIIYITFFPMCSVHMVDIERVVFIVTASTSNNKKKPHNPPKPNPIVVKPPTNDYWYIYVIFACLFSILFLSILLTMMHQKKKQIVVA